jgi:hypothetical protein
MLVGFEIERPDGPGPGIRAGCVDHDEWTEFPAGHTGGTVACERCGLELSVDLRVLQDSRDFGEWR